MKEWIEINSAFDLFKHVRQMPKISILDKSKQNKNTKINSTTQNCTLYVRAQFIIVARNFVRRINRFRWNANVCVHLFDNKMNKQCDWRFGMHSLVYAHAWSWSHLHDSMTELSMYGSSNDAKTAFRRMCVVVSICCAKKDIFFIAISSMFELNSENGKNSPSK